MHAAQRSAGVFWRSTGAPVPEIVLPQQNTHTQLAWRLKHILPIERERGEGVLWIGCLGCNC